MMPRGWRTSVPLQSALVTLGLAALTTGWTTMRALRVQAIPDPPSTAIASLETIRRAPARPKSDVEATAENDVFSIDRSAPVAPYRMPGEPDPSAVRAVVQPEKPLVLGTAIATDGRNFATVQLGNGSPMLVRIGDKVGEWTVRAIERGKIVLVSTNGSRAEVTVSKPGT
jgi:hypothetical protein